MISILGALFVGFILEAIGIGNFIYYGVNELFGVSISHYGYYFIFILIGSLRYIRAKSIIELNANNNVNNKENE